MDPSSIPVQPEVRTSQMPVRGSPMPIVEAPTTSSAGIAEADPRAVCLSTDDGGFGSAEGDQVQFFFFYQVEATPGTTETQMNGAILGDIEISLVDFMIPVFFSECRAHTPVAVRVEYPGQLVGLKSNPADFVLRGCEFSFDFLWAEACANLTRFQPRTCFC
jgi:hypothetical protein